MQRYLLSSPLHQNQVIAKPVQLPAALCFCFVFPAARLSGSGAGVAALEDGLTDAAAVVVEGDGAEVGRVVQEHLGHQVAGHGPRLVLARLLPHVPPRAPVVVLGELVLGQPLLHQLHGAPRDVGPPQLHAHRHQEPQQHCICEINGEHRGQQGKNALHISRGNITPMAQIQGANTE